MNNIINIGMDKKYSKEGELMDRLTALIDEYAGELSLVAVIGILQLKQYCMVEINK